MIKQVLKLKSGSQKPSVDIVGKLTQDQVREIAEKKLPDLNTKDIDAAMKIVAGSARSMGVEVV